MKKRTIPLALCACAFALSAATQDAPTPGATDTQAHNRVIQQALAAAAPFKAGVTQYRLHTAAFPSRNADIGMNLPQTYRNYDVQSIAVGPDGVIDITLTATSGVDGGIIRLTPTATGSKDDPMIEWRCASASYSTIADASGGTCEYTNQP